MTALPKPVNRALLREIVSAEIGRMFKVLFHERDMRSMTCFDAAGQPLSIELGKAYHTFAPQLKIVFIVDDGAQNEG